MKKRHFWWKAFFGIVGILLLLIVYVISFSLIPEAGWMPPWLISLIRSAITIKSSMIADYIFYSLIVALVGALSVSSVMLKSYLSNKEKRK